MINMTIPVHEDILLAAEMDSSEMVSDMLKEYAVKMFDKGKLTLMQSARLCNRNIYDFMEILSKSGVPVAASEEADLEVELAALRHI